MFSTLETQHLQYRNLFYIRVSQSENQICTMYFSCWNIFATCKSGNETYWIYCVSGVFHFTILDITWLQNPKHLNQNVSHKCHSVMVHEGTDPTLGLARLEGIPVLRSNVIILLFFDRFLSCFLSKLQKNLETLSDLQGSGRTINVPSSSLSSLLINSSIRHSLHFSLSFSEVDVDFCRATCRDVSFCM